MTVPPRSGDPFDLTRSRLDARFPDDTAEVTRQLRMAIACADHLNVNLTPELLEELVAEHVFARINARPSRTRRLPRLAIPTVSHLRISSEAEAGPSVPA